MAYMVPLEASDSCGLEARRGQPRTAPRPFFLRCFSSRGLPPLKEESGTVGSLMIVVASAEVCPSVVSSTSSSSMSSQPGSRPCWIKLLRPALVLELPGGCRLSDLDEPLPRLEFLPSAPLPDASLLSQLPMVKTSLAGGRPSSSSWSWTASNLSGGYCGDLSSICLLARRLPVLFMLRMLRALRIGHLLVVQVLRFNHRHRPAVRLVVQQLAIGRDLKLVRVEVDRLAMLVFQLVPVAVQPGKPFAFGTAPRPGIVPGRQRPALHRHRRPRSAA